MSEVLFMFAFSFSMFSKFRFFYLFYIYIRFYYISEQLFLVITLTIFFWSHVGCEGSFGLDFMKYLMCQEFGSIFLANLEYFE